MKRTAYDCTNSDIYINQHRIDIHITQHRELADMFPEIRKGKGGYYG